MLALFVVVAVSHFALSVAGIVTALPAAFDTQAGFWAAPGTAALAWASALLLAPLEWLPPPIGVSTTLGYAQIAAVSALFGFAAVGLACLWRRLRRRTGDRRLRG